MGEHGMTIEYHVGTMIELPRAALMADRIAAHADFFSFGTNDLTQTTFGLSRDDSSRFLPNYIERKIIARRSVSGAGSRWRRPTGAHRNGARSQREAGSEGRNLW